MDHIKLIGLDLDGTVLNKNKEMTPEVAAAIEKALEQGIMVVPVTGRPLSGIPESVLKLKGIRYAITSNGAISVDLKNSTVFDSHFLSGEMVEEFVRIGEEQDLIYDAFIGGVGYSSRKAYNKQFDTFKNTPLRSYVEQSRKVAEDILGFLNSENQFDKPLLNKECCENVWMKCGSEDQCDYIETSMRSIDPSANIIRMIQNDIEIVARSADKGDAFLKLAAINGIRTEETMAVGDSLNDIGFMMKAGLSIAMGNAEQSIKELSDYVTDDCEHSGVAAAIMKFCAI